MNNFLKYKLIELDNYTLTVQNIITILLILILAKIIIFVIKKTLLRVKKYKSIQHENIYTLIKIITYLIWTVAIISILNSFGIKISALITGSAALLVGIGLGLQQTFNDFISGIILLFEGKIQINDILEVDETILKLKNIGLRTTECVDRNGISVIIPNSKIVTDKVINRTHLEKSIRFKIKVGVAYGSDIELVIKLLKESAKHKSISTEHIVEARLTEFGDFSVNFELLFVSDEIFRIEKVKSDLRKVISKKFKENNITIPFPQMDIHFENSLKK